MVVASPRRNKQALPEGFDQLVLFTSLTPVALTIPPAKRQRRPHKPKPEGIHQLDIFSLISEAFEPEQLDPKQPAPVEKPAEKTRTRRTRHAKPGQTNQLTFDTLEDAPAEDVPAVPEGEPLATGTGNSSGELRRDAVRSDSDTENGLLGSLGDSDGGNAERGTGERGRGIDVNKIYYEFPMVRSWRLPEGSLFNIAPEVPETEPHETADAPAITEINAEEDIEQEFSGQRVYLEEPEPESQPSRDFRIKPEHGVGSGGLRQKAHNNIEAIRLLKTLEAENREATDDEKAVLVKYAGWGALPQMFESEWRLRTYPEWQKPAAELKELLTKEEYESARATTPNAHFTSPMVISAIWEGLECLGVKKDAKILEPSMGIGHFFGLIPDSLQESHRTGVELDSITARIAKKLYPDSKIFAQGFEETKLPDDYFDAVVGNVPFGNYPVHDPDMKHSLTRSVHDYFFAKSLDKLRPGGVMALVTSRYTMDKKDDVIRKHLADKADLIGAIRLPNTAFKDNAGTEVVADVIFLKKRAVL